MKFVTVKGEKRQLARKKGAKSIRKQGLVPCVIYGGKEVEHFSVHPLALRDVIYTPDFNLVELEIDGTSIKCIMKEAQFDPVSDAIVHVDFLRLVDGHKIRVEVPVKYEGVAPGLKDGGKMIEKLRRVKITATPENLVDHLKLDISNLELGQSIRVKDLQPEEGVEVMNNEGIPIASVEVPRALKSLEDEEAEAAAAAAEAAGGEEGAEAAPAEAAAE